MALFLRTFRSIDTESDGRSPLIPVTLTIAVIAWLGWFFLSEVTIYEISDTARLEVVRAAYDVDTSVAGRVVAVPSLALGAAIHKGDVLVELDSEVQRLELGETSAKEEALTRQIQASRSEMETEQRALEDHRRQRASEMAAARSRLEEGNVVVRLADDELERAERLRASGSIPEVEQHRLSAEVSRRQAARDALAADVRKLASEASASENDRRSRIAALQREIAKLEGDLETVRARSSLLRHDIEQRKVRAPADGTIGAIGEIHAGTVIKAGDRIATIVASGDMRIVGSFTPAGVFGRVRAGQAARVHFEGFPWTEYGTVTASVSTVASEVRDGRARVELVADEPAASRVPLQHGLPARVAIEIERTTPARLILRTVGKELSSPAASSAREREAL